MSAAVSLFDKFYEYDLTTMGAASFHLALLKHTYTFDNTATSASAILTASESVGTGYARLSGVSLSLDTAVAPDAYYQLSKSGSPPIFASMTTTDYEYLFLYDTGTNFPLMIADAGSLQTVTAQSLVIAGDLFLLAGP